MAYIVPIITAIPKLIELGVNYKNTKKPTTNNEETNDADQR